MSEEIDIIELLKRVKEGKAPKRIEIDGVEYTYNESFNKILLKYSHGAYGWLEDGFVCLNTKIKILDKPIIEELDENENIDIYELARKVNQIIKHINKGE